MKNLPPLPDTLTLKEAAQAMTERTGIEWTERQILGRAVHHEIQINARIGHAVRLIRKEPIEGEENEINAPSGCLPPLSSKAVRALLNADEADFDGWERPKTVNFFGKPAESWVMEFELAPGEVSPVVHFDNCRVINCSLLQLVERYPAPAQTATPAPVVAASDGPAKRSNRKPSWAIVAMPYMKSLFTAGNYKSAAVFYKALIQRAGESDSPFKLVNRELYCIEAGTTVSDGALSNKWPEIRAH
jgi:hypothetical protein